MSPSLWTLVWHVTNLHQTKMQVVNVLSILRLAGLYSIFCCESYLFNEISMKKRVIFCSFPDDVCHCKISCTSSETCSLVSPVTKFFGRGMERENERCCQGIIFPRVLINKFNVSFIYLPLPFLFSELKHCGFREILRTSSFFSFPRLGDVTFTAFGTIDLSECR